MPAKRTLRTRKKNPDWRTGFLTVLANSGNVSLACEKAGISRTQAYEYRKTDSTLHELWDAVIEMVIDSCEQELLRRGREGVLEPVFYQGVNVAEVRKYDTTALLAFLNARAKGRGYGRQDVKLSGDPDAPLELTTIITNRKRPTMADLKGKAK